MRIEKILDIWGSGQLLAFSGLEGATDHGRGLVLRTLEYAALELKLPEAQGEIRISGTKPLRCFLASDCFEADKVTGILTDAHHLLLEGPAEITRLPDCIAVLCKGMRTLVGVKEFFNPAWLDADLAKMMSGRRDFFRRMPDFGVTDEASLKTLAKAYSQLKGQIYSPCAEFPLFWSTPDRWPHRHMWLWDSTFHALGMRHVDPECARELIASVVNAQLPDGMIPHMMWPGRRSEITQPPVLAFGLSLIEEVKSDPVWIKALYPKLKTYLEWIMANRDSDGAGLVEWFIEGDPFCRSGESGMDNSPRFDSATQLDAPDFNAFLSLECECMAKFAAGLGLAADERMWQKHHERLNRLMNELLWNEKEGIYMDRDSATGRLTGVASSAGFLPLLCGAPAPERAARLLRNLNDPETFGTPLRIPAISRKCSLFYRKDMWRGPVWININYLTALGLERYGYDKEAERLLCDTLREEEKFYLKYGTFFEFYDDRKEDDPPCLLRKCLVPSPDPVRQPFRDYGWSATLYIEMLWRTVRAPRPEDAVLETATLVSIGR